MTGAGAPGAAGILRCLQFHPLFEIFMADANPNATGRWLHAEFETIPAAGDKNFIAAVKDICASQKIDVILPLVTAELPVLSKHKKDFQDQGTRVIVSEEEPLAIANDKSRLYQFLEWRDIAVPAYHVVETVDQFKAAVTELGYPGKTVCFKPSVSNGSRGFRVIDPSRDEHELLFKEKPGSVLISLHDAIRILSQEKFPQLLVSEFLPGEEYSVDCLAEHGIARLVVPRLRKKMINGVSVEGEFIEEKNIVATCTKMIAELRLHGNIGIQLKRSATGNFLPIEINPRVQGTISAGLGAGVNLPVLAVKQEMGLPIGQEEMQVKWGTKFSRYWNEVFY
jgi:carbamoyl-phosphate synthase large subunit